MSTDNGDPAGVPGSEQGNENPVRILREQERETASDFISRVRNKIHRRTVASQVASYSWYVPKVVFVEMVSMIGYAFTVFSGRKRS